MSPAVRMVLGLLPTPLVVGIATCGPVGRSLPAPGTWGTAVGLVVYTLFFHQLGITGQLLGIGLLLLAAVAICDEAERRLQQRDPGMIIMDEVAAVPLCFFGLQEKMAATGHVWAWMLAGFLLFRLFDITKPFFINSLQRKPGGWGVVADDAAAALLTCLTLHGAGRLLLTL
jgi:phosphatidylglycerophosphatase A